MTSLKTSDRTPAKITEPVHKVADHSVDVDRYDEVVRWIYAASPDLHSALVTLDGDCAAERIDQAINDLDGAVTLIRRTIA